MSKILCGFSQAVITPEPREVYIDGYGHRISPAEGVRDDLYVKVMAVRTGKKTFVTAVFDICGMSAEVVLRLRGFIKAITGLKDEELAVSATHTHAGPACGVLTDLPVNGMYFNRTAVTAAKAVKKALADMCEGGFRFGFGSELTLSFNRRGKTPNDKRVRVCAFYDNNDRLKGVVSTANCHAVCITDMNISADFPAILTAAAEKKYPGVPFLYFQGRGADIDPHFTGQSRTEMYEKLGGELKDSVFSVLESIKGQKKLTDAGLKSVYRAAKIPYKPVDRDELLKNIDLWKNEVEAAECDAQLRYPAVELMWNIEMLDRLRRGVPSEIDAGFEVAALSNDAIAVFVPFELLTDTGAALEKTAEKYGIENDKIFIFGYSNGTNGYLAPSVECKDGGYEISGAAHWYHIFECCEESEKTVLSVLDGLIKEALGK